MGGLISIPGFGEDKQDEAKKIIEDTVKTFTLHYTKAYGIQLFLHLKEEARKKAEGKESWQLLSRPQDDEEPGVLVRGYLHKMTTGKKFVQRYFVVTSDYRWKYWENEEAYHKGGKPKRVIVPAGFEAVENVLQKLKDDATKLGSDLGIPVDDIPLPKMPDTGVFGLYHSRRRSYVLQAVSDQEGKQWLNLARVSAKECVGFTESDEVHQKAYDIAIRKTRKTLEMDCDNWKYNGTETQVLSEMLIDKLDNVIFGDVWEALKSGGAPATIRIKARDKILGIGDTSIGAAVGPAMTAMQTAVAKLREKIEGVIQSKMSIVADVEMKVEDKIKGLTQSLMSPIVDGKLKPHLSKLVSHVQTPVTRAFSLLVQTYEKKIEQFFGAVVKVSAGKTEVPAAWKAEFAQLHLSVRKPWELHTVHKELNTLIAGLKGLGEICDAVDPEDIKDEAKESLTTVLDNAYYTFEQGMTAEIRASAQATRDAAAVKTTIIKVQQQVKQKMLADSKKATTLLYQEIITTIVSAQFSKLVDPQCTPLLEQVTGLIPEDLSEVLGISNMYERVKGAIVSGVVESVIPVQE